MTNMHKVKSLGYAVRVEPMPPASLLEIAPDEVQEARAGLQAANEASKEASKALQEVRKARGLAEVPSEIVALDDEVHAKEQDSRARLKDARRAAARLASALDAHRETLVRDKARKDLEEFRAAADALPALALFFGGGRAGNAGPARSDLAAHVDPVSQARPDLGTVGRALDETDVPALLERAGLTAAEAGLVSVRREASGAVVEILTTSARAAMLTGSGSWSLVEDESEEG